MVKVITKSYHMLSTLSPAFSPQGNFFCNHMVTYVSLINFGMNGGQKLI